MKRTGEGDDKFIQMNAKLCAASGAVQRADRNVLSMIDEPDQTGRPTPDPFVIKETTMLKTMSATLIAASLLVAPAFAAGAQKTGATPKTEQSTQLKSDAGKSGAKSNAMNSFARSTEKSTELKSGESKSLVKPHAKMTRRHHTYRHYAHRHHNKVSAMHASVKSHRSAKVSFNKTRLHKAGSKVSFKTTRSAVKRG